jgi:hypothetical protein
LLPPPFRSDRQRGPSTPSRPIGTVTNSGKSVARGVQVRADLFLHGKFVGQYSTYVSGTIAPGESQHFKISCGCKDSPPAEHDSFKVEVVSDY